MLDTTRDQSNKYLGRRGFVPAVACLKKHAKRSGSYHSHAPRHGCPEHGNKRRQYWTCAGAEFGRDDLMVDEDVVGAVSLIK